MKKEFTLEDYKTLLIKAKANFARCGCLIYKEEAAALIARINELEATT